MARILITGIAGFFASHLTQYLIEAGHQVAGIDLIPREEAWRLRMLPPQIQSEIAYTHGSLEDLSYQFPFPHNEHDVVINAAAVTHPPFANLNRSYTAYTNVQSVQGMMESIRRSSAKVIHISTFSAYGPPILHPETGEAVTLSEDQPLRPSTFYGWSKMAQEQLILSYQRRGEVPIQVLRMAMMFGPRERSGAVISKFIEKALKGETITLDGGGYQIRDANYVLNAAEAVASLINGRGKDGEIYNIPGEQVSIREIADMAISYAGRGSIKVGPARSGEEGDMVLNGRKAYADLGYTRHVPFRVGFRLTADWVRSHISSPAGDRVNTAVAS